MACQIPALSSDLTKDALGNPLTVVRDGNSSLDTGTELQHDSTPRIIQADKDWNYWFDANGDPISVLFADIQGNNDNIFFANVTDKTSGLIYDIRFHHKQLTGRQLITENHITNN